ncbi:MAG: DUF1846 domain-containing protein [Clostridia bacterium]
MKIGFDNNLYVEQQTAKILERINQFDNKLYLEFGGKLFDDLHASRILPGFDENVKIRLLQKLKDRVEVIFCISSKDIVRNKIRADFGITYSLESLRVIDNLRKVGILVSAIVITLYEDEVQVNQFIRNLTNKGEKVYIHKETKGYPLDVETIVSPEGYGKNPYIPTTRPLVVVTAPGPGSGKLATCLSQLYHENLHGVKAGYAKFETFPIWNLPLSHPINVAYEAATADLGDVTTIDPYHLQRYNITTTNYNRDIEAFPVVNNILTNIAGEQIYFSPTDMGVNCLSSAIIDDSACRYASCQEVIRRYLVAKVDYKKGLVGLDTVTRLEFLMRKLGLSVTDRPCVTPALEYERQCSVPVTSIELANGQVITGKQSDLLTSSASCTLNALKTLAGIYDEVKLLPCEVIEPIVFLNRNVYKSKREMMTLEQVLVALSISQYYNDTAIIALKQLPKLKGCQVHTTRILTQGTYSVFRKLGIDVTSEDVYVSGDLYTE